MGLLDYFQKEKAINFVRLIYECLAPRGIFFTSNIRKNRERIFLDHVLIWPMIYRSEDELWEILTEGGFNWKDIQLVYEPFRIHGIACCVKNQGR